MGNRADNLEKAIAAYEAALTVGTSTRGSSSQSVSGDRNRYQAKSSDPKSPISAIVVLDLPDLTTDKLDILIRGNLATKTAGWLAAYNINYLPKPELEQRWPEWVAAVGDLGEQLWRLFGARLAAALKDQGISSGARLVWLPTGQLGILPFGLAQEPGSRRFLADDYEIAYAEP